MTEDQQNEMMMLTPVKVAFIIDNVVADVLHTDERLAAIFLSDPVVVDITNNDNVEFIRYGSQYDPATNTFTSVEASENTPMRVYSEDIVDDEE